MPPPKDIPPLPSLPKPPRSGGEPDGGCDRTRLGARATPEGAGVRISAGWVGGDLRGSGGKGGGHEEGGGACDDGREPKFVVVHDGEREEGQPREERLERLERVARARSLARQGPRTNSPLETRRSDGGADTPARPWPCCRPVACVYSMQEAFFESSLSVTFYGWPKKSIGAGLCKSQ